MSGPSNFDEILSKGYASRVCRAHRISERLTQLIEYAFVRIFFFAFENKKNILQIIFNKHTHTFKAKNKINPKETEDTKVKCVYVCILCRVE